MTISVIQAVAKNALSNTITATGGTGRSLIVCINSFQSTGTPSITSVKLGTVSLAQAVSKIDTSDGQTSSWIYYLANIAAGQTSVVITGANLTVDSVDGGVDILEVDGMATSSVLDKTNPGVGGTGTAWSSGSSGTLSQANELVVGTACGLSMSSPAGWTMVSGGGTARRTGYKIVSATTAQTFNGTMSTAGWTAAIASFKASGGGANAGLLAYLLTP